MQKKVKKPYLPYYLLLRIKHFALPLKERKKYFRVNLVSVIGFVFGQQGLMYNLTLEGSKFTKLYKN